MQLWSARSWLLIGCYTMASAGADWVHNSDGVNSQRSASIAVPTADNIEGIKMSSYSNVPVMTAQLQSDEGDDEDANTRRLIAPPHFVIKGLLNFYKHSDDSNTRPAPLINNEESGKKDYLIENYDISDIQNLSNSRGEPFVNLMTPKKYSVGDSTVSDMGDSEDYQTEIYNNQNSLSEHMFVPRSGKRHLSFTPRTGKRNLNFIPRSGKRGFNFSPRAGKRSGMETFPESGLIELDIPIPLKKEDYSFIPRSGKRNLEESVNNRIRDYTIIPNVADGYFTVIPNTDETQFNKISRTEDREFNFMPRSGKRYFNFIPRPGKKNINFVPRPGKKNINFSPRHGKRNVAFIPRPGKKDNVGTNQGSNKGGTDFIPRPGRREANSFSMIR